MPKYFDVEAVVNLEDFAEEHGKLEEIGKLPHVPDVMKHGRHLR